MGWSLSQSMQLLRENYEICGTGWDERVSMLT